MAKILILGGGFGGVVAAEQLAQQLGGDHQITLVSRSRRFVFYPSLVRLAFGQCGVDDVSFDLRHALLDRRVNFIEAEVAHIDPAERRVVIAHGEIQGNLTYDYLVFALGRRLATERITGFYEHAHHLLDVNKAIKFGKAVEDFHEGHAVIGECAGARLPVPVYETAFALARQLEERGERERARITIVSPLAISEQFGADVGIALKQALDAHGIEFVFDFAATKITKAELQTGTGQSLDFKLLMLLPPFQGSPAASYLGITDDDGYIKVDDTMRVVGQDRVFAVGDSTNFSGPKLGHMAVRQATVAAANVLAEIKGDMSVAHYRHELKSVIDIGGKDNIYLQKDMWANEPGSVRQGHFWHWAKRAQQQYWELTHS